MSFLSRCLGIAKVSPFSFLVTRHLAVGAVRTATKRAGGTVHNHGGSPGKRLGVKKFSGIVHGLVLVNVTSTKVAQQTNM
ncbi:hypothetical protein CVT26_015353 [Gymnopilus dilepis]|uniref:Uncharacterized protein n=1 Tax=Gymnopilus dilepis TaxID=231916 RepID=A0A409WAB1_9AGAR|nr:hypothetical protein CVT26_015353 [Gymnopilus dilepis]